MVHLRRDLQAMIDRAAGGEAVGARLLHFAGMIFAWWRRLHAGSIHRQTLRSYAAGLRPVVRSLLEEGTACACPRTATVCREVLRVERSLWTFAAAEGGQVEALEPGGGHQGGEGPGLARQEVGGGVRQSLEQKRTLRRADSTFRQRPSGSAHRMCILCREGVLHQ